MLDHQNEQMREALRQNVRVFRKKGTGQIKYLLTELDEESLWEDVMIIPDLPNNVIEGVLEAKPEPLVRLTAKGTEAAVCEDIARRQQLGLSKYGVSVADNPLNLREWLQHAYEECLDQAVYLKRAMEEVDKASVNQDG